jgi:hypothetical protein
LVEWAKEVFIRYKLSADDIRLHSIYQIELCVQPGGKMTPHDTLTQVLKADDQTNKRHPKQAYKMNYQRAASAGQCWLALPH